MLKWLASVIIAYGRSTAQFSVWKFRRFWDKRLTVWGFFIIKRGIINNFIFIYIGNFLKFLGRFLKSLQIAKKQFLEFFLFTSKLFFVFPILYRIVSRTRCCLINILFFVTISLCFQWFIYMIFRWFFLFCMLLELRVWGL